MAAKALCAADDQPGADGGTNFSDDPEVRAEQESVLSRYYHLVMLAPLGDGKPLQIQWFNHERVFGEYDLIILNPDYQERNARWRK